MSVGKSYAFRTILLVAGVAALIVALILLWRHSPIEGFLFAYAGLSAISLFETSIDYEAKYGVRTFLAFLKGRSCISTLGLVCDIGSYLCLAAALISWLALR